MHYDRETSIMNESFRLKVLISEREENSCHMLHTSYISSCMLRLMSFKLENKNQKHLVRSKFKQKHTSMSRNYTKT